MHVIDAIYGVIKFTGIDSFNIVSINIDTIY